MVSSRYFWVKNKWQRMKGNVRSVDEVFCCLPTKGRPKSVTDISRLKEMSFVYSVCGEWFFCVCVLLIRKSQQRGGWWLTEYDPGRQAFIEMGLKEQELPSHQKEARGADLCKYFKRASSIQITPECWAKKSQMLLRHLGDMPLLLVHLFSFSC